MKDKSFAPLFLFIFIFSTLPAYSIAENNNLLSGSYYGTSTITTPTEMPSIDLAFCLDVSGSSIQHDTSYIMLDKTMIFPSVAPEIGGKPVGPRVSGTISPVGFTLDSDAFDSTVSDRSVSRQITLDQATVTQDGQSITGTYTETITGLLPQNLVISGPFVLVKPVSPEAASVQDSNDDGCIDLAEIRAGGDDPDFMEFRDAGAAMAIYNGDGSTGQICAPADQNIKIVLQEYYNSQK